MHRYFDFAAQQTDYRREVVAGFTTFLTMAYIIIINPAILEAAGIPQGPSMTATILSAAFGTLIMGFYAKRPFAIAPYMGENAFIAFTVVKVLGFPWQTALGAIFLAGVAFTLLTLLGIRGWLANAIPLSLKFSLAVGIGLFLTFIGLNETGIVVLGVPGRLQCISHRRNRHATNTVGRGNLGLDLEQLLLRVDGACGTKRVGLAALRLRARCAM